MNESPAQQTLPESTPAGELERLIREADQTNRAHRSARFAVSTFMSRDLLSMPPTDSNLDALFDCLATVRTLSREVSLPGPDGDELAAIARNISAAIERFQLAGAYSKHDPTCRNVDLMHHAQEINLTPAMVANLGHLPGIHLDKLLSIGDAGRRLYYYLLAKVSADNQQACGNVAILPGNCRLPPADSTTYVGKTIVRFASIEALMDQEAGYVRAERYRQEQERQRATTDPTAVPRETAERQAKRHIAEADVAADQRRREATGRTT